MPDPDPGAEINQRIAEYVSWAGELVGLLKAAGSEAERLTRERDEARAEVRTLTGSEDAIRAVVEGERDRIAEERDRLAFTINEIAMVRRWVNEDGKGFVFADDLLAVLRPDATAKGGA